MQTLKGLSFQDGLCERVKQKKKNCVQHKQIKYAKMSALTAQKLQ